MKRQKNMTNSEKERDYNIYGLIIPWPYNLLGITREMTVKNSVVKSACVISIFFEFFRLMSTTNNQQSKIACTTVPL